MKMSHEIRVIELKTAAVCSANPNNFRQAPRYCSRPIFDAAEYLNDMFECLFLSSDPTK